MKKGRILPIYTGLVIAYLFIPIFVMALFGFNDPVGRFNFQWHGFTLEWYRRLFDVEELVIGIKNSLLVATVSTFFATIFGTLMALAISRYKFRGRSALNLFIFIPMATPEVVLGVSLLGLFVTLQLSRGFLTLVITHILFCISYVVVTVRARTTNLDSNLEDAAQDLGADPWTTFWTVTFPLILPGIVAGAFLAFALSIDDYVISSFNAGSTITLPLWIVGASRIGVPPQVNVMGTLLFMVGVLYVVGAVIAGRRKEKLIAPPVLSKG
ncbi:MAG: spermidine/putrescine transport system permease protein [Actinomycetota bacterium]|jgi:spermidine/putrescine transport system permease protein|nr:spermidine/putrescine transport system permease protein [Actinomycetota bacterium]